jgi:two-component system sensor histidine kinase DesK
MPDDSTASERTSSPRVAWLGKVADIVVLVLAFGPYASVLGTDPTAVQIALGAVGATVLGVLCVYHLRMVRGGRRVLPLVVTLAAMVAASYGLAPILGTDWLATPAFLLAAVVGAMPWRRAWPLAAAIVVAEPVIAVAVDRPDQALYGTLQVSITAAVLYGFARAVATAQELDRLRDEVASMAVVNERLRVSRDLHDLLGRSLAGIGLKAELALRYQENGSSERVTAELGEIVDLAHQSSADLRELVGGYRQISLAQEVRASRALLERNAVTCTVDVDPVVSLPAPIDQVLAWTLREAVTNVLRHSSASQCLIEGSRDASQVALRVRNDSVLAPDRPPAFSGTGAGTGLMGIAERVAALGGSSQARQHRDGWFELAVRVPMAASESDGSWGAA